MRRPNRPTDDATAPACRSCGRESHLISRCLGLCADCIRGDFDHVLPYVLEAHTRSRKPFHLPGQPPRYDGGATCKLCVNECQVAPNGVSYCGLRTNRAGRLRGVTADRANVSWYYDPLPTNCVADWVCPGGTGSGFPDFACTRGPERGYKNLAVFYQACSFNCLFCQNWHYRYQARAEGEVSASTLAQEVDERTSCICYFGGDPTPQLPHALRASRLALEQNRGRILRVCWETNGSMHPGLLRQMAGLSLKTGGCIKFDLKAWSEELHIALCGVSNRRTLENFRMLASYVAERPSPPLLVASTLLVPGYVEREEVSAIAAFVASLSQDIPYSLLAFCPQFMMSDLPTTSRQHAQECLEAATKQGLKNVKIGNLHLLKNQCYT
jgi:pyruvate formate lyase activating enzyme